MTITRSVSPVFPGPVLAAAAFLTVGLAGCSSAPERASTGHPQAELTPPAVDTAVAAADPTTTDPSKYRSIYENDRVRVLRYHDEPGDRTRQHRHPDAVVYALSSFTRKLSFPDGTSTTREFAPGDVMWVPAQVHVGENIGSTPTDVLLVELKSP